MTNDQAAYTLMLFVDRYGPDWMRKFHEWWIRYSALLSGDPGESISQGETTAHWGFVFFLEFFSTSVFKKVAHPPIGRVIHPVIAKRFYWVSTKVFNSIEYFGGRPTAGTTQSPAGREDSAMYESPYFSETPRSRPVQRPEDLGFRSVRAGILR